MCFFKDACALWWILSNWLFLFFRFPLSMIISHWRHHNSCMCIRNLSLFCAICPPTNIQRHWKFPRMKICHWNALFIWLNFIMPNGESIFCAKFLWIFEILFIVFFLTFPFKYIFREQTESSSLLIFLVVLFQSPEEPETWKFLPYTWLFSYDGFTGLVHQSSVGPVRVEADVE